MADYIWAQTARILGADRVAGTDADEVEALPTRSLQRLIDRGFVSLKPEVDTAQIDSNTAALATKQDAATAATDAELAQLEADIAADIAAIDLSSKQDAATAATDAELAAAIAGVATGVSSASAKGEWAAASSYAKNDVVTYQGDLWIANKTVAANSSNPAASADVSTAAAGTMGGLYQGNSGATTHRWYAFSTSAEMTVGAIGVTNGAAGTAVTATVEITDGDGNILATKTGTFTRLASTESKFVLDAPVVLPAGAKRIRFYSATAVSLRMTGAPAGTGAVTATNGTVYYGSTGSASTWPTANETYWGLVFTLYGVVGTPNWAKFASLAGKQDAATAATDAELAAATAGSMKFKGNWEAGTAYNVGDAVNRAGVLVQAAVASTGVDPTSDLASALSGNLAEQTLGGTVNLYGSYGAQCSVTVNRDLLVSFLDVDMELPGGGVSVTARIYQGATLIATSNVVAAATSTARRFTFATPVALSGGVAYTVQFDHDASGNIVQYRQGSTRTLAGVFSAVSPVSYRNSSSTGAWSAQSTYIHLSLHGSSAGAKWVKVVDASVLMGRASKAATDLPSTYPEGESWRYAAGDAGWPTWGFVSTIKMGNDVHQLFRSLSDATLQSRRATNGGGDVWGSWTSH